MKIGITGLANSGKTTVFNALTGLGAETTPYPSTGGQPNMGVVKVPDPRVDRLSGIFNPRKTTFSTVHYVDYIGLTPKDLKQNRTVLEFIKDADALVQVVRAFEDEAVLHPLGRIAPLADVETVEAELLFGDLELVERRLETMEASRKKGGVKINEEEKKVLLRARETLEAERPLRDAAFGEAELRAMRHLQFMSIKPEVVVLNVGETDLGSEKAASWRESVSGFFGGSSQVDVQVLSGKVEMEIAELPPEEARDFLDDLGIEEPALDRLIRVSYDKVGLISFFTVGADEVRAWAVGRGTSALRAAGKIHSDIERGFIRAEVVSYDDFMSAGASMAQAREKGLLRLEGKSYEVKDGDIVNFRFNV
ncbi:MAG: redox-regulated ATPase YchF [Nitrospirota bacterium]|jgi:GTP-binding protein YchF